MKISACMALAASATIAILSGPAMANGPSSGSRVVGTHVGQPAGAWQGGHRWGPRYKGRWYAGWRAPGGWSAYRRPVVGYVLPRYWISPGYYIANYGAYGLPAPAYGYGWSRYYDDAVMTDRYGRVTDYRSDIDWDRYEGGYGPDENHAENSRPGDNPSGPQHGSGAAFDGSYDYGDDSVTTHNDYEGRWTGTWTTDDGRKVSGTYDGRFEGSVRGAGVDYPIPPYAAAPHWGAVPAGGYVSGGYYYPAPIVTTVTVQPAVTTTTTTTYVTEKAAYRKPVRRRAACRCK